MFEVYRDMAGTKIAEEKIQRAEENPHRFNEALEIIEHQHGISNKWKEILSKPIDKILIN